MEDYPAKNTRNLSNSQPNKENPERGNEKLSANKQYKPIVTPPHNSNIKHKHQSPLSDEKINKIKDRARRLSGSLTRNRNTTVKTPKSQRLKKKKGINLSEEDKKALCIRKYLFDQTTVGPPEDSLSPLKMPELSETISEAHSTLHEEIMPENMSSGLVQNSTQAQTTTTPQHTNLNMTNKIDDNNQSPDGEVTIKTPINNIGRKPTHTENQTETLLEELPANVDNLSNSDMFRLILSSLSTHKQEIKSMFSKNETRVQNINTTLNSQDTAIKEISTSIENTNKDHTDLKQEVSDLKDTVQCLSKIIVRQDAKIDELETRNEQSDLRATRNNIVIKGLVEHKNENCMEVVNHFFKDVLKISSNVSIQLAHRIGKGDHRPMLIYLKHPGEKGKIYKHTSALKDARNELNKKYQVRDQLPPKENEAQNRIRSIKWKNSGKTVDQLALSFKKKELSINNVPYTKMVIAPKAKDIVLATGKDKARWRKVKTVPGNVTVRGKCYFQGFSLVTNKIETIRDGYLKLRESHGDVRHIVCGFRLPGRNFALLQDYDDDDEFGAGAVLLKLLEDAQILNRAVFVTRRYGGEHLGPARFQAYAEAAQSAITHDPYNQWSKENQNPWPKDKSTQAADQTATTNGETIAPQYNAHQGTPSLPADVRAPATQQNVLPLYNNDNYMFPTSAPPIRGRLPSGPLRPTSTFHNYHKDPLADEWERYNHNAAKNNSWFDQTSGNFATGISSITSDMNALTTASMRPMDYHEHNSMNQMPQTGHAAL